VTKLRPISSFLVWQLDKTCKSSWTSPETLVLQGSTLVPAALSITTVYATIGGTDGSTVTINGFGFESGATVSLDGATTNATIKSSQRIVVQTAAHAAGTVDVVVTNPNGQSGRLNGGFTYAVFTLTVNPYVVTAGSEVSVSWVAPGGGSDWVALFNVGEPNENCRWWQYTEGAVSGTLTLDAPTEAGQYEFRYLVDDDFIDVGRSSPLTVK
jgi:hypothetical protein